MHSQMMMKPKDVSLNKTSSKGGKEEPIIYKDGDQNPFSSPLDSRNESRSFQPPDAMRNHVRGDHTALQLEFKNHSSTIALQLRPPKCNSYATTLHKYDDLLNKFPC